jgi:hypothetical protein
MNLIVLALACIGVQFAAKYVGVTGRKIVYDLIGLGGMFFLLTVASSIDFGNIVIVHELASLVATISPVMGWLCLVGATLLGALEHIMHPGKLLPH